MTPKHPQILGIFLFLYELSEELEHLWIFTVILGALKGIVLTPPPNYCIFSTPPQIGLKTIISRRKQKKLGPPQKIAGDRP